MQVRWEQINTQVAAKVAATPQSEAHGATGQTYQSVETVSQSGANVSPASSHDAALPWLIAGVSVAVAVCVVFLYMAICFHLTGPALTFALTMLPVGMVGLCIAPPKFVQRPPTASPLRGPLHRIPDVHSRFAQTELTRAERLYSDVVLALSSTPPQASTNGTKSKQTRYTHLVPTTLRRDLLRECNALIAHHVRIEARRQQVQILLAQSEPTPLIVTDSPRTSDPVVEAAYAQSAELQYERERANQALPLVLARLNAHDELICQALLLARTALIHAEAAPIALAPPDVSVLRQTVRRILRETQSVEEAVQELESRE